MLQSNVFRALSLSGIVLIISIIIFNGNKSIANKIPKENEKFSTYENIYKKLVLKTTKGNHFELKSLKKPVLVLNFWASWCQPCVAEFKSLNKFIKENATDKIQIIGINNDEANAEKIIKKTEDKYQLKFESVVDENNEITSQFEITAIPATIVYVNGKVVFFSKQRSQFSVERISRQN